ncbi:hypothetical protein PghCCS26_54150 [Paenibacillus glycanilyticus]|uniref:Uncharacterized protein n=1 Tax=Paenibacillus glycanilyticus TaxID=126569 RepID=A0ABQ6NW26_9BACL|nr:hypothetical protein [Paenibacillus glycanilyticus]GMK48285.1 hypothetical protein PghCCS26_54150 [Paenibacillus glycanilyticus]
MNSKEMEQIIIESYKRDEDTMILVFAQWCVNHGLDAAELYARAYPEQIGNSRLLKAIPLTAPKEEAGDIDDATVLQVLSLFGNEELAFVVSEEIDRRPRKHR